jgi:mannose-1-phosphate guanylyltransferase/mannose-6-phosphate isomerase
MKVSSLIHPVILCGGLGTRLWPLSRKSYPKQFSQLLGEESLFQGTARRLSGPGYAPPVVLTGDAFRFIVTEQLAAIEQAPQAILIEPSARNTAPAVLAAALWLEAKDPDALMLVAPADHAISNDDAFREAVAAAVDTALAGDLVAFGIEPTRPEVGYGYIELDKEIEIPPGKPVRLKRFVEKPDLETATAMLAQGGFLWNAGIFLFSVRAIVGAYERYMPELIAHVRASLESARADLGFTRLAPDAWNRITEISIDYAIMEKADNLSVMPYTAGWNDLGAWDAVWRESAPDADGNVCSANALALDCRDTLLRSEAEGLELVGIGLDDVIAVAMPDAVLIARKSEAQRVKEAVDALKARGVSQAVQLPRDYRPWGWYEALALGGRFQVKRIVVNPGASLSLQSHVHRAEHWIVVAGTAKVTVDNEVRLLTENQSVYIPLGAVHRMENPGKVPMMIIEVQTGSYLGEDDIVRYEDAYARN